MSAAPNDCFTGSEPTRQDALLPCPFCGEQPKSYWQGSSQVGDDGYWAIECCHVHVHTDAEEDAIHDWNLREPILGVAQAENNPLPQGSLSGAVNGPSASHHVPDDGTAQRRDCIGLLIQSNLDCGANDALRTADAICKWLHGDAYAETTRGALLELLSNAYNEGFGEGMREHTSSKGGWPWNSRKQKYGALLDKALSIPSTNLGDAAK